MKAIDVLLMLTLSVLVLLSSCSQAARDRNIRYVLDQPEGNRLSDWLLSHIEDYRRDRRTQMDAGFLSRHSALKNFLNSYDAAIEANDPYGPGR